MTCTAARHGTVDAHQNHRCRCPEARLEYRRYMKRCQVRRARGMSMWTDATGTQRRLQALHAIGWTWTDLGSELGGLTRQAVTSLFERTRVHVNTARAVAVLYDRLWMTDGGNSKARKRAAAAGWPPPLWWLDDEIDDPCCSSKDFSTSSSRTKSSTARDRIERHAQIVELSAKRWSARQIAEHVGCTPRTVVRLRSAARAAELSGSSVSVAS
jgi:hypothetical protein